MITADWLGTEPDPAGAGPVDVAEQVLAMMLPFPEFEIDVDREDDDDILAALNQAVILPRTKLLTLLNCAEADLQGAGESDDIHPTSNHPQAQTLRELHALIAQLDPAHACSLTTMLEEPDV